MRETSWLRDRDCDLLLLESHVLVDPQLTSSLPSVRCGCIHGVRLSREGCCTHALGLVSPGNLHARFVSV